MSKGQVDELMVSTRGVAFPPFVQIKITEHHVMSSTFASFRDIADPKDLPQDKVLQCLRDLGRKLCWLTKDELRQQKAISFEQTKPSYGSIFYLIMNGVPVSSPEAVEVVLQTAAKEVPADVEMPDFSDGQIVPAATTKGPLTGVLQDSSGFDEVQKQEISVSLQEPCLIWNFAGIITNYYLLLLLYQRLHALKIDKLTWYLVDLRPKLYMFMLIPLHTHRT